ncbi:MAG: hypothetical protein A3D92_00095 [Bacteroidetes bacterium RIFCSPHIGHO2_02_FULL_44_7]|nr:MAG: hypothetical protein A3D92_00095 [Bacteroidetes bacterium RIFCSPHIGHO2_02_FULL_44_7]
MSVLIVEDDPIIVEDLKANLLQLGYEDCRSCGSVSEAKVLVEQVLPSVVIVDIQLQGKESGIDLGRWLSAQAIPFFYMSGKQDVSTFLESGETQAVANLSKPVGIFNLRNTLYKALTEGRKPQLSKKGFSIPIPSGEQYFQVDDLLYVKACRAYCELYFRNQRAAVLASMPLNKMLIRIKAPEIVRIHNSHAVNIMHVRERRYNLLYLNGLDFPLEIGQKFREPLSKTLASMG